VSASFVYDPFGRRAEKIIGGTTTQFLYDGLNPLQELNGASTPSVTANLLTGLNIDEYFTRTDASGTATFLSDALGIAIGLTNSSGAVATSYTYDPFDNVTASGTGNANPYQFAGRENDGTGLYFNRGRYYSPAFQRFVSQDPIGFAGGDANIYRYGFGAPTNYTDPLGFGQTNRWNNAGGRDLWIPTNGEYGGPSWTGGLGPDQSGPLSSPVDSADACTRPMTAASIVAQTLTFAPPEHSNNLVFSVTQRSLAVYRSCP